MTMQEEITNFVIDCGSRFPQASVMLTADDIREELIRRLDDGSVKGASVARALSIAPARVTEMRKRERKVQQNEMQKLAEFLGMIEAEPMGFPIAGVKEIPNLGKVAQGVWLEQSELDPDLQETVAYDQRPGDPAPSDLFAVTPEGTSMNLRFMPGTQLICRKVPFGTGVFKSGDYVIAQRNAHELVELTVKRLEIDDNGVHWLHSESTDERFKEPWRVGSADDNHHDDREVSILAKVIRAVQDFERPLN